jgi:hypothetical protein
MPSVKFANRKFELPANRAVRITIGVVLVIAGGLFGFLPILGYWMVPLGLVILSIDVPAIRRLRRRSEVAVLRWWNAKGLPRWNRIYRFFRPGPASGKSP